MNSATSTPLSLFRGLRGRLSALVVAGMIAFPAAAADPEDGPRWENMVADAVIARPFGLAATVGGSAIFVVTLPFTALGGNVKQAADTLVVGPARETFVRCLGCTSAGRGEAR